MQPGADDLRDGAVNQICTDGDNRADAHNGNEERRHHGAAAHAGHADKEPYKEAGRCKSGIDRHLELKTLTQVNSPRTDQPKIPA